MAPRVMPIKYAKIQDECAFWMWKCAQTKVDEIARLAEMLGLSEATVEAIWNEAEDSES